MIRSEPAEEVLEHVRLITQKEADDLTWALSITLQPHQRRAEQRKLIDALKSLVRTETLESPYDVAKGEERTRLIGSALVHGGENWRRTHPRQMDWLREHSISPDEAMRQYRAWKAIQDADPFWKS